MTRFIVLLIAVGMFLMPAAFAEACSCAADGDGRVVQVRCFEVSHCIRNSISTGADAVADAIQWTAQTGLECSRDAGKLAGSTVGAIRKSVGGAISSVENHVQKISTEVISQSLQQLRSAFSTLWDLVSGHLRY